MKKLRIKNKSVLLDDDIYELVKNWNWTIDKKGYPRAVVKLHKLVTDYNKKQIDHINRNKLDNRRKNLRVATNGENIQNRKPSGNYPFKGVHFNRKTDKWVARIGYKNNRIFLGLFNDLQKALLAYDKKALELYGKHAYTNILTRC